MIYAEILYDLVEYVYYMPCPVCEGLWFFTFQLPINMEGEIDEDMPCMCEYCLEEYNDMWGIIDEMR